MSIGRCERSDDVVEPRLKTQWFIKTQAHGRAGHGGRARGPHDASCRERFRRSSSTGWRTSTTGTSAASCGGATASRRGTAPTATSRSPTRWKGPTALRCLRPARRRAAPGRGHLRHLVLERAVAVLDARLARRHARPAALLPDHRHGDRLRHHLLLGGADDDARRVADRPGAVPHGLPARHGPRPVRRQDVQDEGQRRRPARGRSTRSAPTRCASRWSTAPRRRRTRRSSAPRSRARATSPTSSGTPPASCSAHGPPRLPRTPALGLPSDGDSGRPSTGSSIAAPRPSRRSSGIRRLPVRRGAGPLRRDLERVLRLVPRAGQDRPVRPGRVRCARSAPHGRSLTWVLDRYLRLLHPIMPTSPRRSGAALPHLPTDPELLIVARWPSPSDCRRRADQQQAAGVRRAASS